VYTDGKMLPAHLRYPDAGFWRVPTTGFLIKLIFSGNRVPAATASLTHHALAEPNLL
jgi:hypothetical protein